MSGISCPLTITICNLLATDRRWIIDICTYWSQAGLPTTSSWLLIECSPREKDKYCTCQFISAGHEGFYPMIGGTHCHAHCHDLWPSWNQWTQWTTSNHSLGCSRLHPPHLHVEKQTIQVSPKALYLVDRYPSTVNKHDSPMQLPEIHHI